MVGELVHQLEFVRPCEKPSQKMPESDLSQLCYFIRSVLRLGALLRILHTRHNLLLEISRFQGHLEVLKHNAKEGYGGSQGASATAPIQSAQNSITLLRCSLGIHLSALQRLSGMRNSDRPCHNHFPSSL